MAVLPWAPDKEKLQYKHCAPSLLLTSSLIDEHGVGPGDELVITGLFTERFGKGRNFPIVRTGIIAAMPGEPLFDETTGREFPAYIAEVRSIGGLSGSPVFLSLEPGRVHPKKNAVGFDRKMFLLGVIRGHWDYRTRKQVLAFSNDELSAVNMGMALITPIEEVSKLLYGERFMNDRKEFALQRARENAPIKDAAFVTEQQTSQEDPVFSEGDFLDALKRVSRKQSDEEKS